jgi:hypothetical protein
MDQETTTPLTRTCGTMQVFFRQIEEFPAFRASQAALHAATALRFATAGVVTPEITRIPVVVHVVFRAASDNLSADQVESQIDVLNRDFRAANTDLAQVPPVWTGLASDARIEFFLAQTDPAGEETDGITRTETNRDSFGADDSIKSSASGGVDAWPTDRYLNIWVGRLSGGLLGYAQFPGGPAETDGVVVLNTAFGTTGTARAPFNLGRTTTHEVGHWLNLRHIWADTEDCSSTDFVDDTPNAAGPNFGTPAFPHVTCNNGPNGDMFMNYMDYVDDAAMMMFTAQQVARMQTALDVARPTIGR